MLEKNAKRVVERAPVGSVAQPTEERYARRVSGFGPGAHAPRGGGEPPLTWFARPTLPVHIPSIRPLAETISNDALELLDGEQPPTQDLVDPHERDTVSVPIKPPIEAKRPESGRPRVTATAPRVSLAPRQRLESQKFTPRQTLAALLVGVTIGFAVSIGVHAATTHTQAANADQGSSHRPDIVP